MAIKICKVSLLLITLLMLMFVLQLTTSEPKPDYWKVPPDADRQMYRDSYSLDVIEKWVEPEMFISAEMLQSRFGDFDRFYFYADLEPLPSSRYNVTGHHTEAYTYIFNNRHGGRYDVMVSIEKLNADRMVRYLLKPKEPISKENVDSEDLRVAKSPGTYWLGDIGYTYVDDGDSGRQSVDIDYIQWKTDEHAITIFSLNPADVNSLDDGGFLAQLLREESAEAAVDAFNTEIAKKLFWEKVKRNWLPWIVPGLLLVLTVVIFLLIRRSRKKKTTVAAILEEPHAEKEE